MITKTHDIILKLAEPDYINSGIKVVANDYLTNIFNIRIFDDLTEIDYTQIDHATIVFAKPDNTFVQGNLTKAAAGYTYIVGTNDTAAAGTVTASVQLYGKNNERLTPSRVQFIVIPDLADKKAIESTSEFTALTQAKGVLADLQNILIKLKAMKAWGEVKSDYDENGIATSISYKRIDGTMFLKVKLGDRVNGIYKSCTVMNYDRDGVTVVSENVYDIPVA